MNDRRFERHRRVLSKADFDRVYDQRRYVSDEGLVINGAENGLAWSRLGLAVGKPVGNAVRRNRWKRLIREAFRLEREALPVGYDFVVRPRPQVTPNLEAVRHSLVTLTRRLVHRKPQKRAT